MLAGLLLSACAMPPPAGAIEKGTYSQIVTRERRVTVVGLPEMGQVLERHGAKVEVLLPPDSKRTELTLWFRVAVAADDTRRFEQAVPRRAQLELRAFGFLPKLVELDLPAQDHIDGKLFEAPVVGPACDEKTPGTSSDKAERAFELGLMRRDAEALALFEEAYRTDKQSDVLVDLGHEQARLGDAPAAVASYRRFLGLCPGSAQASGVSELARGAARRASSPATPAASAPSRKRAEAQPPKDLLDAATLSLVLEREDPEAAKLAGQIVALAGDGRARDAQRQAQSVAARLSPRSAASLLRVPTVLLAERWLLLARQALDQEKPIRALHLLADARDLAPDAVAGSHLEERALALRAEQLGRRARALESTDPTFAAAYFMAWKSTTKSNAPLPASLAAALQNAAATTFAVRDRTDLGWAGGASFHQALLQALRGGLPGQISLRDGGPAGQWDLGVALAPPQRKFAGNIEMRTKRILAFSYMKANPEWLEAATAVNRAVHAAAQAKADYQTGHATAMQEAQSSTAGGPLGALAGTLGGITEGAAQMMVRSAANSLRDARARLRSTSRRVQEDVTAPVHYPALVFTVHATAALSWRLAGAVPRQSNDTLLRDARAELIEAVPEWGVDAVDSGVRTLAQAEPDYAQAAQALGATVAATVTEAEEARLWANFEASSNHVDAHAIAAAIYLLVGTQDERRELAGNYLKGELE